MELQFIFYECYSMRIHIVLLITKQYIELACTFNHIKHTYSNMFVVVLTLCKLCSHDRRRGSFGKKLDSMD